MAPEKFFVATCADFLFPDVARSIKMTEDQELANACEFIKGKLAVFSDQILWL